MTYLEYQNFKTTTSHNYIFFIIIKIHTLIYSTQDSSQVIKVFIYFCISLDPDTHGNTNRKFYKVRSSSKKPFNYLKMIKITMPIYRHVQKAGKHISSNLNLRK